MLISPRSLLSACFTLWLLNGCALDKSFQSEGGAGGQAGGTTTSSGGSLCGNGKKDLGENCDGSDLSGQNCESQGFAGGILKCSATCVFDPVTCLTCGDGIKNGADVCDGSDLNSKKCADLVSGSPGGNLICRTDCTGYDTSKCDPPATCNNGKKDPGEECEGADVGSATCRSQGFDGGTIACNANCTLDKAACFKCGDLVKNGNEGCDAADLGGADCQMLGNDGGILSCKADCSLDTSACYKCGDGTKNGTEECDMGDLGTSTCENLGNDGGSLSCNADCTFNTAACIKCGDGNLGGNEQCDGNNLNGQDCGDFNFSTGTLACKADCTFDSTACTNCSDGKLDAGEACDDGNTMNGDGCSSACAIEQPTGCNLSAFTVINDYKVFDVAGDTTGDPGISADASCAVANGGGGGKKVEYGFKVLKSGFLAFTLRREATNFDSALAVRTTCANDANEKCADSYIPPNLPLNGGEVISLEVTANSIHYVLVDGYDADQSGMFQLRVDFSAGTCADPVPVTIYPGTPMKMYGDTTGNGSDSMASCGGSAAPDVPYLVQRSTGGPIVASVSGPYDKAIYSRAVVAMSCTGAETSCQENGGSGDETLPSINFANAAAQTLIVVDGHNQAGHQGVYTLTLSP